MIWYYFQSFFLIVWITAHNWGLVLHGEVILAMQIWELNNSSGYITHSIIPYPFSVILNENTI